MNDKKINGTKMKTIVLSFLSYLKQKILPYKSKELASVKHRSLIEMRMKK